MLMFENSVKSAVTRKVYLYELGRFVKYYKLKSIESTLEIESKQLQIMMEDYLFFLKKRLRPRSLRPPFSALELFYRVNEKQDLNFYKIRKMFPADDKSAGKKSWSTQDIQKMLRNVKESRTKAVIHILASTGCRIGAIHDLKISSVIDMPDNCMGILFYEGSNEEYWGFLTPEASGYLKEYLHQRQKDGETLNQNHPLIREKYQVGAAKPYSCSIQAIKMLIARAIKNASLRSEKNGQRFDTMMNHGFRKRFNTIMKLNKNISPAMTEKLMGHKVNLDGVYMTPTRDECFAEFTKAIADFTIDPTERQRITINKQKEKITELEDQQKRIDELEVSFNNLSQVFLDISGKSDAEKEQILEFIKFSKIIGNELPVERDYFNTEPSWGTQTNKKKIA